MRKLILPMIFILSIFTSMASAVDLANMTDEEIEHFNATIELKNGAVKYHILLFNPIKQFPGASYEYMKAMIKMRSARKLESIRKGLIEMVVSAKKQAEVAEPYNGDSTLLNDYRNYLDLIHAILTDDFGKVVDMEDIAERSFDKQEEYEIAIDSANSKLNASFFDLKECEAKFFRMYHVKVKDDKSILGQKIDKANKLIDYYEKVNRIVGKANRYYNYAKETISNNDLTSLEQHTGTVNSITIEGIKKLNSLEPYEGSDQLLNAAKELISFYKTEGETTLKQNVDFMLSKDRFNSISKKFSKIKKGNRTKEIVDQYNEEVNNYNDSIGKINKINNRSYKDGNEFLKKWRKSSEDFLKENS